MAERKIKITLDNSGNVTFHPTSLRVHVEDEDADTVTWEYDGGDFTIAFAETTPFDWVERHGHKSIAKQPLRDSVDPGTYHYRAAVAKPRVTAGGGVEIFMVAGCPDIIVEFGP